MPARNKTIRELRRELKAKETKLRKLHAQRRKITARLGVIDGRISALAGDVGKAGPKRKATASRRARKRPRGEPLVKYIQGVLARAKQGMRAKDVATAVVKAGYRSTSKDFYGIVAATLRESSEFKRVSRGVYKNAG